MKKICIQCGTELSGKQTKYCSKSCNRKWFWRNNEDFRKRQAEYLKKWKKENPDKVKEYHERHDSKSYERYKRVLEHQKKIPPEQLWEEIGIEF